MRTPASVRSRARLTLTLTLTLTLILTPNPDPIQARVRRRYRCCSTLSKPTASRPSASSHVRPHDSPTQAASNPGCIQNRASGLQHCMCMCMCACTTYMCASCSGTLSREYNAPGAPPLLYNTHQAYLRGAEVRLRVGTAHTATHTARGCTLCCVRLQPPAAHRLQPRLPTVAGAAARGARPCTHARLHARRQAGAPKPHPGPSPGPSPSPSPSPSPNPNPNPSPN